MNARVIAFYLPQFHPIPENDEWWGAGFTEWTNVGKARPLFKGHKQPRVPKDLGYYDLRISDIVYRQEEMARFSGVEGFAYWHYWWAGRQLLEQPLTRKLSDPSSTLPFCIAWANETWSGIWHGSPNKILMEQTYPGLEDHTEHFYNVLPYFHDPRYIRVNDRPLFYLYCPLKLPKVQEYITLWQELAMKEGLAGIHFIGLSRVPEREVSNLLDMGFDAVNVDRMGWAKNERMGRFVSRVRNRLAHSCGGVILDRHDYGSIMRMCCDERDRHPGVYPTILPQWDNSPRCGRRALILTKSSPELFENHVRQMLTLVADRPADKKIIFLKSWNEWAEGNYVEPDIEYGWGYLEALRRALG